uniref:Uncharacterized protein n=1 Tax=Clytia hemisphaerica TaxID=252671 RepID=A0A7M5WWB6_9CNID
MGNWISVERGKENVGAVKNYCESVVFVRFYGQTNSMKGPQDHEEVDGPDHHPKTQLGHILNKLDQEIRKASAAHQLEITDEFKELLRDVAKSRVCTKECENEEECHKRLLGDAEKFVAIYKKRGCESEVLHQDHSFYWGTRQQMLFGKVIVDWLPEHIETKTPPMDPIFGTLLNPTGGLVGPGDLKWMHDSLFDDLGPFAYHSAVHDAFGYLKTNHNSGPGYCYLNKGIFGDWSPFGGQLFGLRYWNGLLGEAQPEEAKADQFVFK